MYITSCTTEFVLLAGSAAGEGLGAVQAMGKQHCGLP